MEQPYHSQDGHNGYDGAAMGSPVSPVVANIYMEMSEDLVLKTKQSGRGDMLTTCCVVGEVNVRHKAGMKAHARRLSCYRKIMVKKD